MVRTFGTRVFGTMVRFATMLGEFWYNGYGGLYHVRGGFGLVQWYGGLSFGTMLWKFVPC